VEGIRERMKGGTEGEESGGKRERERGGRYRERVSVEREERERG